MRKRCVVCQSERQLSDFSKDKRSKDGLRGTCKGCSSKANRAWHLGTDREKLQSRKRAWKAENRERARELNRLSYARNREGEKARVMAWAAENPHAGAAKSMRRKAIKKRAMPKWLSKDDIWMIQQAYELAKLRSKVLGGEWHVDHIAPLSGELVCGLHVPWNLQVIPGKENIEKSNKFSVE